MINEIKEIITSLNKIIDNIDIYYKIYEGMINNYENKKRNCPILQNIIDMHNYNNKFYQSINNIINDKNIINVYNIVNTLVNRIIK